MHAIFLGQVLIITTELICFSTSYYINYQDYNAIEKRSAVQNQCQTPCPATCSPQCLPGCCVKPAATAQPPAQQQQQQQAPAVKSGTTNTPCGAPAKPDMMITSVEEGETEECGDKGFNAVGDNSEDPPGTITIPLPPTMYTPPKPGEEAKELPLPDFKLPASILQGIPPPKSMTLTPDGEPGSTLPSDSSASTAVTNQTPAVNQAAAVNQPLAANQASAVNQAASVSPPAAAPITPPAAISKIPPAPPAIGNALVYPKLPPVTVSEIPGKKPLTPIIKPPVAGGSPLAPAAQTLSPSVKLPPITVSEIPGKKPVSPIAPVIKPMLPPVLPAVLPPSPPPIISPVKAPNPVVPCPIHCEGESRDDCCTINPGAPPPGATNAHGPNGNPAAGAPAAGEATNNNGIPGVLEVTPSVVTLGGGCGNPAEKANYDQNVVKQMHQELSAKYL